MASQPHPQRVDAPLTASAIFLVVAVKDDKPISDDDAATIRGVVASVNDIAKNVAFRDPSASLVCTVGIGSRVWDTVTRGRLPRPSELHPFKEVKGAKHTAVSTPGDVLFHIRAERRDMCFELERQLLDQLGDAVKVVDETVGFRYFDNRDLLGFVDGTANPTGDDVTEAVLVSGEDVSGNSVAIVGGSYVVVQKYLHAMPNWRALGTEKQEAIIGRTKLDNMELDDATGDDQRSHKTLNTIEDDKTGAEFDILRDNMPFGSPGAGEYGTYFIGYSRRLWVIERMLERMFIGVPPGKHDRLLDYSTAVTGSVFFMPSLAMLDQIGGDD
ncbi:hypothetical protein HMPREF1624_08466 [Sporothrix schenckii ATCC 58251]|uniref:Dyp-type peroxidase n=1 Tax=Sporothrix schenckii (strain ATCC 58251 / de Perez 2211183) TaxID=1391915 RepID=U7PKJ0_SPOS1|nr:hypothetical protein HMPREF1624_08466 [Sporothrix schenckii ATCC 58251]